MSILFDHAIRKIDVGAGELYSTEETDLERIDDREDDRVPVRPIAAFASQHDELAHPSKDWTCIPLHGADRAVPEVEFVGYTDHDLQGEVFVVERDGDPDSVPAEEFGRTRLARRIRFWHSDYRPDTVPPDFDAPIDDREPPRTPVDSPTLFDGLRDYVAAEREETRAEHAARAERRTARGIYRQGGDAVPALDCVADERDGTYRFRVDLDEDLTTRRDDDWSFFVEGEFGIHEGNEVLLHAPADTHSPEAFPLPATVAKIRGLTLWLAIDWADVAEATTVGNELAHGNAGYGLSSRLNPVPFDREATAVDELAGRALGEVLAGERPVTFTNGAEARSSPCDTALNQAQQLAVRFALLADDVFCIHGPPGTGKTRTLVEIVRRAADAGETVLVCADSNQAVDNLVVGETGDADGASSAGVAGSGNSGDGGGGGDSSTGPETDDTAVSLHAHGQHGDGEFVLERVNARRSSHDVVRRNYGEVPERGDVVVATNNSAATLAREFDLAVLDEATQATCTASAIPLARADRAVLAGDHQQLPPFSATEEPPDSSFGLSLFEHLYADGGVFEGVGIQLKTQYRMHPDIAYLPNREFYDRSLRTGRHVEALDDRLALVGYNTWGAVETVDHSKRNDAEARLVTYLVAELLAEGLSVDDIGVITPYAAQVTRLEDRLDAENRVENGGDVVVDTIDGFQGGEKTAVLVSLVRSNDDGEIGFLGRPKDGPRRLNVALTRAKRYCAVVADWHTLRSDRKGKCTDLYRTLYAHFDDQGRMNDVDPTFIPVQ